MTMRLYVPATLSELDSVSGGKIDFQPRRAHTATKQLIAEMAEHDVTDLEEVEYIAQLAAADDSLMLVAQNPHEPWLRLVISVDVPDGAVTPAQGTDEDGHELPSSAVDINQSLPGIPVVCVHVDEMEAAQDIQGVLEGDEAAMERLSERDLLWYDVTELPQIPR